MIDFNNTQVAFSSKSDSELKRAHRLFSLLGKPWLMKLGKTFTLFAFKARLPIQGLVKRTIFKQFCGGEDIKECQGVILKLNESGIGTILDYSVEGKEEPSAFERTTEEILQTVDRAKGSDAIPFSVFKVSGIARFSLLEKANNPNTALTEAEKLELADVVDRVDRICKAASDANTPVFIDAEESWIQDAIDRMAETMMVRYNKERAIVYNTIQLYRHDRLAFIERCISRAEQEGYFLGLKLVRGAYMEKERDRAKEKGYASPIQPDKASTDRDFDEALRLCLRFHNRVAICAGTHNEASSLLLTALLNEHGVDKTDKRFYFAQLLGMSDHISYNLANEGYRVAKYVPYGPVKEVLPYLMRRAEENTSVAGQTGRELSLIRKEIKRRKTA